MVTLGWCTQSISAKSLWCARGKLGATEDRGLAETARLLQTGLTKQAPEVSPAPVVFVEKGLLLEVCFQKPEVLVDHP